MPSHRSPAIDPATNNDASYQSNLIFSKGALELSATTVKQARQALGARARARSAFAARGSLSSTFAAQVLLAATLRTRRS
jgi:hypothetical protein